MLFPYRYIAHELLERYQGYLDFLFEKVWLEADPTEEWSLDRLTGQPDLYDGVKKLSIQVAEPDIQDREGKKGATAYQFLSQIARIYAHCQGLNAAQRKQLRKAYTTNQALGDCCEGTRSAVRYADVEAISEGLGILFKTFYSSLWGSSSPFNLKAFDSFYTKHLKHYYETFMQANGQGVCPFCGIHNQPHPEESLRSDLDHFLPQAEYPFLTLNLNNLAPACTACNRDHKKAQDPLRIGNQNTRAFYPYQEGLPNIKFEVEVAQPNVAELGFREIQVQFIAPGHEQEVATWQRLYGIPDRYRREIASATTGATYWLSELYGGFENIRKLAPNLSAEDYFAQQVRSLSIHPHSAQQRLKRAFLEYCHQRGWLHPHTQS